MRGAWLTLWLLPLAAGCSSLPRSDAPNSLLITAAPSGFAPNVRATASDQRFFASLDGVPSSSRKTPFGKDALQRMRAAATDGSVDILALSGGGAGGAFGAGALVGMSRGGNRPQFEMVTGVSTGALLAPFAFLGPAWDKQLVEAFSANRLENILQWRVPGATLTSLYKAEPLIQLVDGFVTDELVQAVASEAAKGRLLLVATTDLDREETVIWNLGQIAARGGDTARLLFRDVLVASASIPGLLPPVMIRVEDGARTYEEMHVDGGAIRPFFSVPDIVELWGGDPRALPRANLYVLVNTQLGVSPTTTAVTPFEILERSFSTTLKHMARTEISLTADFALRYGMNFRFTEIPLDYPFAGLLDFGKTSLEGLFDYATDCASKGYLWTTVEQARHRAEVLTAAAPAERADAQIECPLPQSQLPSYRPGP